MKLLVLDCDGVLTDGIKKLDKRGCFVFKGFADIDITAIERFRLQGIRVCILSGDKQINKKIAEKFNIDFYHAIDEFGKINKRFWLSKLMDIYKVAKSQICYVGDDMHDYKIMCDIKQADGFTFCPNDASPDILDISCERSERNGGKGVVADLLYRYLNHAKLKSSDGV